MTIHLIINLVMYNKNNINTIKESGFIDQV